MGVISRHWKGVTKPEETKNYINHLRTETFPQLLKLEGFIGASILRRPTVAGTEFLVVTTWQSMEAIRQFSGPSVDLAVVPAVAQAMMIEYDKEVAHYEVEDCIAR